MYDTLHIRDHGQTLMVAHRGCSGLELENTASAFVAAGNRSYWGIETDIHCTADGQFILFHDDNTKRICGDSMVIEETSFDTLRSLRMTDRDGVKGRRDLMLPTLEEYASICRKYGKKSVLELKNHMAPEAIDRIIAILRSMEHLQDTVFISFDLPNMIHVREVLPEQPAQFLISDFPEELPDILQRYRLDLDIDHTALREEHVQLLHSRGIKVNVWTPDKPGDVERYIRWGVDYVTSNICE